MTIVVVYAKTARKADSNNACIKVKTFSWYQYRLGELEDILSAKCFDFDTGLSFKRSRLAQIVWRFDQDQTRSKFFHRFIEKHVSQNYEIFELVKNLFVKMPLTKLARRYHSQRRPKQQGRVCKNWKCISFLIWKDVSCILDVENFILSGAKYTSILVYSKWKSRVVILSKFHRPK